MTMMLERLSDGGEGGGAEGGYAWQLIAQLREFRARPLRVREMSAQAK